jgi:hypothetical protein
MAAHYHQQAGLNCWLPCQSFDNYFLDAVALTKRNQLQKQLSATIDRWNRAIEVVGQ